MVADEWHIEEQRQPFSGNEEEKVEKYVQDVLWQDQRVQTVALVNRVLVVSLQFVEGDNLKVGKRNEFERRH